MFMCVVLQGWITPTISYGFSRVILQGWIFTRVNFYKGGFLEMEMSRVEMESQGWKYKGGKKMSRVENTISTLLQGWKSRVEMDFEKNPPSLSRVVFKGGNDFFFLLRQGGGA